MRLGFAYKSKVVLLLSTSFLKRNQKCKFVPGLVIAF